MAMIVLLATAISSMVNLNGYGHSAQLSLSLQQKSVMVARSGAERAWALLAASDNGANSQQGLCTAVPITEPFDGCTLSYSCTALAGWHTDLRVHDFLHIDVIASCSLAELSARHTAQASWIDN